MMCKSVDNLMALEAKICEDQLQLVIASRSINLVLLEDITIYRKKLITFYTAIYIQLSITKLEFNDKLNIYRCSHEDLENYDRERF
ncbi:hypothetical protein QE152_g31302 [Popillia japonica]|uniref:Uncharacterized protein n=1 Tax=Popillia japonica TaxID=7064 RepID=A0AAW1JBQ7_POPJA